MEHVDWQFPPENYEQSVTIQFADQEAAARAQVMLMPLFEGYSHGLTSRWDDNQPNDLVMKEHLEAAGLKGTWYLNGNGVADPYAVPFREIAAKLIKGGHSVGGHSLSHPYITYVSRNRAFQEMAGVRIEWEAALDTPATRRNAT